MKPLEDVRIIAIEQYGAGPWGSVHLADLGADVIKVEDARTGGDIGRYIPPFQDGEDSLFFETFNRNKRSLSLDLLTPGGRSVLEDLVRHSDAVYSNLRGDVPARLRIRYEDLKHLNPRIVCCSLSAYGMDGPRAAEPGYDYILQGIAGWMTLTGEPGGPPQKTGLSLVDFAAGFVAGYSLLAGLHAARRDGIGMDCDVSLHETALGMLNYLSTWHLTGGYVPQRTRHSAHPSLVPFQNFQTADAWMVVGCAKEKFFQRLLPVLGLEALAEDERFATFEGRGRHREELLALLEPEFLARTSEELLEALADGGVPCGPINDIAAALRDPQIEARGTLIETQHPIFGAVRTVASPVRVGPASPSHRRAPRRHEDAQDILVDLLGYDEAQVSELTATGAFGAEVGRLSEGSEVSSA